MEASITADPFPGGFDFARLRIPLIYLWRHARLPDLASPQRFTELVQLRKLHDRDPMMPQLADKVGVKQLVADRIGQDWIIPTLWHGPALPERAGWPRPFVVKSRHGCNQCAFVRPGDATRWRALRRRADRWVRNGYAGSSWLDEWGYRQIPRGILVEPFIGAGGALPIDYKLYVFGGRVAFVQVHLDREHRHRWMVFDRDWRRISCDRGDNPPPPPSLARMIEAAEALAGRFEFVRVDMYDVGGRPLFGEMTFYPGSGLDRFDPVGLDIDMGQLWLAARSSSRPVPRLCGPDQSFHAQ